jgi:CysZ protein
MATELHAAPGLVRRAAAGAWHVPGGFAFLARRPRSWLLALLPAVLCVALLAGGLLAGLFVAPTVESTLMRRLGSPPEWLGIALALALWTATVGAGVLFGLAIALLLAAPVLDKLSRWVEAVARGEAPDAGAGLRWDIVQSARSAVYFVSRMPAILLVGLVPLVGPVLSGLWAAHALAFQNTDSALARRGLDFAARRRWHRRYRAESLGLGGAGLVCLVVPCAGFLLAPALVTGGTLLVLELTEPPAPIALTEPPPPIASS